MGVEVAAKAFVLCNLKKCWFHQEEMRFLGYIVSYQYIWMEKKQIKAVHDWLEP